MLNTEDEPILQRVWTKKSCIMFQAGRWRITRLEEGVLLCGSPRSPSHSCGSKPAWTDHQTASAPCGTGWAGQRTAADVSQAAARKRPPLPSWTELLQPAESHNTPSWSENTNRSRKQRQDSLFIKRGDFTCMDVVILHDVGVNCWFPVNILVVTFAYWILKRRRLLEEQFLTIKTIKTDNVFVSPKKQLIY